MDAVTTYLELFAGGDGLVLRLQPDRDPKASALARALGHTLSYLDLSPAPAIGDRLSLLARAFVAACERSQPSAGDAAVMKALACAVDEVFPGATLRVKRRVAVDQRVPRWPLRMRSGEPDPSRGRLWPYDTETTAMRLGLRRLVLREWLDETQGESDARWLESNGLVVARVRDRPESGPLALFAAQDERTIAEARETHREACMPGVGWQHAARWMGEALGYPRCCIDSFVRARMRDDVAMFADLLPPSSDPPSSPLAGWLVGSTTLISHAPCSSQCAPTRALASATLAEIDRRHAGFAKAWDRLARRVHAIDAQGRCFAFDAEGALDSGARVVNAAELVPPSDDDRAMEHVIVEDATWCGGELSIELSRLVARTDGVERLRAGLACDQRG